MKDDTNRTSVHDVVAGSLDRHARAVGTPAGDLADVLRRVDRRRARRRSTAVIGSTLAVAAGAAGIMFVASPADAPAPGSGDPGATGAPGSWGCSGFLSSDGVADYWVACDAFADVVQPSTPVLPPVATSGAALPTVPATIPPGPTTTITVPVATAVFSVPTGQPTIPPAPATTSAPFTHTVAAGDSVYAIAGMYGIDPLTLAELNGWPDGIDHMLTVGDTVLVPVPTATTVVIAASTVAVTNPPICESGSGATRVTVPCSSAVPSTIAPMVLTTSAPVASAPDTAFRCTDRIGSDLRYTYYRSCEPWARDAILPTPTTAVLVPAFVTNPPPVVTAPPTPTTAVATGISPVEQIYTVVQGDSLSSIAALHGIDDATVLAEYNGWPDGLNHPLFPGDTIRIPPNARIP